MKADERISEGSLLPLWVLEEHLARYRFAAQFVKGKVVIDCACGEGYGESYFINEGATQIVAFDTSSAALQVARKKVASEGVCFQMADAHQLPLADESADVFISLETIEHLKDDEHFMSEIQRILRSDGILVCSTPNRTITNPGTRISDPPENPFHLREYSEVEFVELLCMFFDQVDLYGQRPTPHWRIRMMAYVAQILPMKLTLKLNRLLKLIWRLLYRSSWRTVLHRQPNSAHEYLVAVCRKPHQMVKTQVIN